MKIYKLIDPRDGRPRYIGITSQHLLVRLCQHISKRQGKIYAKDLWINELLEANLLPEIKLIKEVKGEYSNV